MTPPIELSATRRIPLCRLIRVELRKLRTTPSTKWVLLSIVATTVTSVVIAAVSANRADRTFVNHLAATAVVQGLLLAVLGVLMVTGEWTRHTAAMTFTQVPARGRVALAKLVTALAVGAVVISLGAGVAALASRLAGSDDPWTDSSLGTLGYFTVRQLSGLFQGVALGLLFLNTALGVLSCFALPTALTVMTSLPVTPPWFDLMAAQQAVWTSGDLGMPHWTDLAIDAAVCVALPFVVGLVRLLRTEVT